VIRGDVYGVLPQDLRDVANPMARWLNKGLRLERNDPGFKAGLDHLDAAISGRS